MKKNTLKKVVVVGGGNGSGIALDALKRLPGLELSAVISMSDSGGSSGALRRAFQVPPPGDILRAVLALSAHEYSLLKKIFYRNRISGLTRLNARLGPARDPNLGNLFLLLVSQFEGDFLRAVRALEEALEAMGHAYPVTLEQTDLCAELTDGTVVKTEALIDRPTYERALKIVRVWLEPQPAAHTEAKKVLRAADMIVLSPGSLYASVVATLLPGGVREAIAQSRARLVYVAGDAYEKHGETGPEKLSDFVGQLERYLPRKLDVIVYNNTKLTARQKRLYTERHWGVFAKDVKNITGRQLVGAPFENPAGGLSSQKLAPVLKKII